LPVLRFIARYNTPRMEPAPTASRFTHRRLVAAALIAAALGCGLGASTWWYNQRLPKRFGVVAERRLYRSGEVTPAQLQRLQQQHGIRTVVSLLDPTAPESVAERTAADALNMTWINIPLRGNGASTPADRNQLREVLADESLAPVLVHCAAGTNRTGLAVGMYRLHHDGWPLEKVMEEMKRYDFEDEAHHENLRQALQAEAERARPPATTQP
jgi:protein tyrosine/serine phosphatase